MLLETHVHSSLHSKCSIVDPVTLIRQVVKKGLQGIIFTEHHYLWTDQELENIRREAEVDRHFLILSGQEVETDIGHVLVFGADKTIEGFIPLNELRNLYPLAALVWAHPFRNGKIPSQSELLNPLLDGIEIFSLNQTVRENYEGLTLWHKYKFTALSGSDTHSEAMAGLFPAQFDHPVKNISEAALEIKESRCKPFFKEISKSGSDMLVTEITIGTKGDDELRKRIIVKAFPESRKWQKAKDSTTIIEKLYSNGFSESTFRVPKIIEINEKENLIIEECQRGRNLFDLIANVSPSSGIKYFELAAKWIAKLHNLKLKLSVYEDLIDTETRRFIHYYYNFIKTKNPYLKEAEKLINFVKAKEEEIFLATQPLFVQTHGDFHPKNIIIGQDRSHDPETVFVSVIDFNNSMIFLPAFDVGYFLAQFSSQFSSLGEITKRYKEDIFLNTYLSNSSLKHNDLEKQVNLFKIRANLSIASFFIKVGKGQSKEMSDLILKSLALMKVS